MRTAICISGHLRHYDKLKENFLFFKKYLESFSKVDVFISTWNKQNTLISWSHAHGISNSETVNNFISEQQVKDFYETEFANTFDYDFYSSNFSPLNYKDWTDTQYSWDSRGIGGSVINSSKMFFLVHEVNKLKKMQEFISNSKYDLVIRTRPDYEYKNFLPLNKSNIKENTIYSAKPYECSPIDDQFAFGTSASMDKYAACFLKQSAIFNSNIWGDPENILINSLLGTHKISIQLIDRIGCLGSDVTDFKR
jgi:hypothetical protein